MEGRDKQTRSMSSSRTLILASEVGENDVLLGRGVGPSTNSGNVAYRSIVRDVMSQASSAGQPKGGGHKQRMARQIVNTVYSRNGRFLRKLTKEEMITHPITTASLLDPLPAVYVVVPDYVAVEKARQAMRFQKPAVYAKAADSTPAVNLSPIKQTERSAPEAHAKTQFHPALSEGKATVVSDPTQNEAMQAKSKTILSKKPLPVGGDLKTPPTIGSKQDRSNSGSSNNDSISTCTAARYNSDQELPPFLDDDAYFTSSVSEESNKNKKSEST